MNERERERDGRKNNKNIDNSSHWQKEERDERGTERGGERVTEKRRWAAAGNRNIKGERSKEKNVETSEDKHHT